jgi:hypothetical protein
MEETRNASYKILVVQSRGKRTLEDIGVDGSIILRGVLKKRDKAIAD